MWNRAKPLAKFIMILFVGLLAYGGIYLIRDSGLIMKPTTAKSIDVGDMSLPTAVTSSNGTIVASKVALPTNETSAISTPVFRWDIWAWNSQMGLLYANGGANTTKGSLMELHGVRLNIERQDNSNIMQQELIKFAKAYKDNKSTSEGKQFVAIMGDGSATFLAALNSELVKIGENYTAQVIGSCGKSLGEDKLMAPADWKTNPQAAKGSLIAGVLKDGDWNIAMKWAGDNDIKVNPDPKTYDPDAINWVNSDDFIDAAQKYIAGYSESRVVVKGGKVTGIKQTVAVNAVVTWTPGDVQIAESKGGLVSVVSTKEYRNQMPNVIIGIKQHMQDNRKQVESMLAAIFDGGDQVKQYPDALAKAGVISALVYKEKDGKYWSDYYTGLTKADKTGLQVELGGSRVHNLADNKEIFGLSEGGTNIFGAVYKLFGDLVVRVYPKDVPSYPALDDILDTSYLKAAANVSKVDTKADMPTFNADDNIRQTVSKRNYAITFKTGSAEFTPAATSALNNLFDQALVAGNLKVEIHGYTDNVGNENSNQQLSLNRANAIKAYLENKSSNNFGAGRVAVFAHGSADPVATNTTETGRSKNRRVSIVLGS